VTAQVMTAKSAPSVAQRLPAAWAVQAATTPKRSRRHWAISLSLGLLRSSAFFLGWIFDTEIPIEVPFMSSQRITAHK